jgi:hypothetical protein
MALSLPGVHRPREFNVEVFIVPTPAAATKPEQRNLRA